MLPALAVLAVLLAPDARHVRALYLDALGRTPSAEEREVAEGASADTLTRVLCGSREFWESFYDAQLAFLLLVDNARPADGPDGPGLVDRLAAGELGPLDALRTLVGGPAFHRANPGNDTFVTVVLEQVLGLTVQDHPALLRAGKRMYDGAETSLLGMRGDGQSDLVAIAFAQDAAAERLVAREHRRLVGADADTEDVARWAVRLRADPGCWADLARDWLLSPAYEARLAGLRRKSDAQFLRGLWMDLTGAVPEREALEAQRRALESLADATPLRAVLARAAAADAVFERRPAEPLVRELFLRFLGREPGPDEREDFTLAVLQEGADATDVARALVTSWEYQYY